MSSLSSAGQSIAAGPRHSALFQIKHLLILREQLAPFQMESSLKETTLDWSKLKDAAYGLVQQRANLFSLSSNNALLQFIVEGTPQVHEEIMDSKRDVDNELKKVCEQLISTSTNQLVGPIISLIERIDVILDMNMSENQVKPIALKNQPFAAPEKISEHISTTCQNIRSRLPALHADLHLYLANRDTEFILLKPVRMNVLRYFSRLSTILTTHYTQDDVTIANCPSSDELNMMMNSLLDVAAINNRNTVKEQELLSGPLNNVDASLVTNSIDHNGTNGPNSNEVTQKEVHALNNAKDVLVVNIQLNDSTNKQVKNNPGSNENCTSDKITDIR